MRRHVKPSGPVADDPEVAKNAKLGQTKCWQPIVCASNPIGTPEAVMLERFQWLAEEVMPAFTPSRR